MESPYQCHGMLRPLDLAAGRIGSSNGRVEGLHLRVHAEVGAPRDDLKDRRCLRLGGMTQKMTQKYWSVLD